MRSFGYTAPTYPPRLGRMDRPQVRCLLRLLRLSATHAPPHPALVPCEPAIRSAAVRQRGHVFQVEDGGIRAIAANMHVPCTTVRRTQAAVCLALWAGRGAWESATPPTSGAHGLAPAWALGMGPHAGLTRPRDCILLSPSVSPSPVKHGV